MNLDGAYGKGLVEQAIRYQEQEQRDALACLRRNHALDVAAALGLDLDAVSRETTTG